MLRYSEFLCLALILSNTGAFLGVWLGGASPASVKLLLLGGFVLFFLLVLVALGYVTPLARARRPRFSALDEPEGLAAADFRTILTLAPRHQKAMAGAGLVALLAAAIGFGSLSWSTDLPFERRHALGIALYVAALASLLYPVLGALGRLPESLEDRLRFLRSNDG